ncbi:MAG: FmdE family protein [Thermoproteota archaeon]
MNLSNHDMKSNIRYAQVLHGHLGPFLVIGVRLGILAKQKLNLNSDEMSNLQVTAELPLLTPFSCILDGLQITTQCTLGNQKLRFKNSQGEIKIHFNHLNSPKEVSIHVNRRIAEELQHRLSQGASKEELAKEIISMPEDTLFALKQG